MSIFAIGVLTAVIGDLASHFGCFSHMKDSIIAITFVALGTSVPGRWKFNNNWAIKVFQWLVYYTSNTLYKYFRYIRQ